jgi:putative FmdB family regulatory protein
MPTYDYICPNGHRFEVIHGLTATGPDVCPVCGASPVRKAFSAPSVHYKGSGWAKKDRGSAARKAASASETAPAATGSDGGSGDSGSSADGSASTPASAAKSDSSSSTSTKPAASGGSAATVKDGG